MSNDPAASASPPDRLTVARLRAARAIFDQREPCPIPPAWLRIISPADRAILEALGVLSPEEEPDAE